MTPEKTRTAIIIGAGPAGLTAALELLRRTDIKPIVLEASDAIGGISRTVRYKGNRMDIGGHRFFSKSDRVMQWWLDLMPVQVDDPTPAEISYQGRKRVLTVPVASDEEPPLRGMGPLKPRTACGAGAESNPEQAQCAFAAADFKVELPGSKDLVMLLRPRKSRIYYLRKFFDYPIKLSAKTLANLGPLRTIRIGMSYFLSRLHPKKPESSLEDFLINRFGRELYFTFFKSYTEKVWGTSCDKISAEWGAQRIKGLSLTAAVKHFFKQLTPRLLTNDRDISQKATDTSLIERFLYPKFGPGQLWEHVAEKIIALGGEIRTSCCVDVIETQDDRVEAVETVDTKEARERITGDYFISSMPMKDLVRALEADVPQNVREVSEGLEYRDFITIGVLANRLEVTEQSGSLIRDTWIYIQEPDVRLGRLQIFNNWSRYMVADREKVWVGLEYFCSEGDSLWRKSNEELVRFGIGELEKIGIVKMAEVLDAHVVRVPKTYPAYFGTYSRFGELREYVDSFQNLFLIGRNGMHKYNNQDHSMLTAMAVVDGLASGHLDKAALWGINSEQQYHEGKTHS